jgi:hypothetical protein
MGHSLSRGSVVLAIYPFTDPHGRRRRSIESRTGPAVNALPAFVKP